MATIDISVVTFLLSILAVSSGAGPVAPQSSGRLILDVCSTLNQDVNDIHMCCDKARGVYIGAGEVASITYLCCLGYFHDVKISYMDKITFDLLHHIVKTSDERELILEAQFIVMCQDSHAAPLTLEDFEAWKVTAKTRPFCRIKA